METSNNSTTAGATGSPIDYLNLLLDRAGLIAVILGATVALGLVLALFSDRYFTAESRFRPEGFTGLNAPSVAAQFGLGAPAIGGRGESLEFYQALLTSREVLREAVQSQYEIAAEGGTERMPLTEFYDLEVSDSAGRVKEAMNVLRRNTSTSVDIRSGLVTVRVSADQRGLAEQINARLLELLDEFNRQTRSSQARSERQFLDARLERVREDLGAIERQLEQYLDRNRGWHENDLKRLEVERFESQIALHRDVVQQLMTSRERARMEEVRTTPVLSVVESPLGSGRSHGEVHLPRRIALSIAAGLVIAAAVVFAQYYVAEDRARNPEPYRRLERSWRRLTARVRNIDPRRKAS